MCKMGAGPCALAVIVVLLIIITTIIINMIVVRRRERFAKNTELLGVRSAVARLEKDLVKISRAADSIKTYEYYESATKGGLILAKARQSMAEIINSVKRLQDVAKNKPYTYQSAVRLYQGLSDSDKALLVSAQSLSLAGKYIENIALGADDEERNNLKDAAAGLHQMSSGFYDLIRSVHYLGSALLLE